MIPPRTAAWLPHSRHSRGAFHEMAKGKRPAFLDCRQSVII